MVNVRSILSLTSAVIATLAVLPSVAATPAETRALYKSPTPPAFKHLFSINWVVDLSNNSKIMQTPAGFRFGGIPITSGNVTDSKGKSIGIIIGGVGGEYGYIDGTGSGLVNVDVKYTIQFDDGHYGYGYMTGIGGTTVWRQCTLHLETDSTKYKDLTSRFYYVGGKFINSKTSNDSVVVLDHFTLDVPPFFASS